MARPLQITDDTIVKALAAGGEVTAAELADQLGMGQSTAARRLATLDAAGTVRRTPGGRVNGVRAADRWSSVAAAADTAEPAVPDTDVLATNGTTPVEAEPAGPGGSGRLGRGQLRTLIFDYLRANPGEVSPAQLSKVLGHSAGAISNALVKLVDAGEVVQTGDHPRRYAAP